MHVFIQRYLSRPYYMSGTALESEDTGVNKRDNPLPMEFTF